MWVWGREAVGEHFPFLSFAGKGIGWHWRKRLWHLVLWIDDWTSLASLWEVMEVAGNSASYRIAV